MELKNYFDTTEGSGVLATADDKGRVNVAIYSRPHVLEDGNLAFIMRDKLTHRNIQSNPFAAYLFHEKGPGHQGLRLHLTKIREETNSPLFKNLCRRCNIDSSEAATRFVVIFEIDNDFPLIGSGNSPKEA